MAKDRPVLNQCCAAGIDELAHCHATLVLHADGSLACAEVDACDARPDLHLWWITCAELASRCGCTGDEHQPAGRVGDGLVARAA